MTRPYGVAPPGFVLPDNTRLGAVRLQVRDLDRSIQYYERVIGLRLIVRRDNAATLGVAGSDEPLVRLQARHDARPVPRGGRFGLYHFAILLPDRAALGRFATHLADEGARAGMADHLVSEAFYLTDPDGLGVEVYADRPPGAWAHHDRELAMSTDPLDVADVVASAGGRAWDGAPAGTRIGHLHLHVGDLGRAEAFFHVALGFDKMAWSYPGALFLSAGGYHHHLGTNTWSPGPSAAEDEARLLEWELVLPHGSGGAAAESLQRAGYAVEPSDRGWTAVDPWGTPLRIR